MWAQARQQLRLSSDEFWDLTPRELYALYEANKFNLHIAGLAPSAIYNVNRRKKSDPAVSPMAFFETKKAAKPAAKFASAQDILLQMDQFELMAAKVKNGH